MNAMVEKFATLWPEVSLLVGATLCLFTGLAPNQAVRRATVWIAALALVVAGILLTQMQPGHSSLGLAGITTYVKLAVVGVGLILLLVAAGVPSQLKQTQLAESSRKFEPGNVVRGEFFAFFLISLTGAMLTASADDLVWLFLALELTSLPTYVMVSTARDDIEAQESGVKYFFLGAMSAAIFLYGFALIYGATGFTDFASIQAVVTETGTGAMSSLMLLGLLLSVVGICFKIAAVPMHFYAADVYQGAATPVTAFLAFVPKTAGFLAIMQLLFIVGWPLPPMVATILAIIAVLTMTVGNVLGLLQNNVKRVLAYSSVAHSGYMLVGVIAGPGQTGALSDGIAAVLFYLVAYGLGTIAAFAVLGCLRREGDEAQTFDDLSGLSKRHPALAGVLLLSVLSLLGLPPLIGFVGKIYLFVPAYNAGYVALVVIALVNSAISAAYYLRIVSVCYFGQPTDGVQVTPMRSRVVGAVIAAVATLVFGVAGGQLVDAAHKATQTPATKQAQQQDAAPAQPTAATVSLAR